MIWTLVGGLGFVRLSTLRGVLAEPVKPEEALGRMDEWFEQSPVCGGIIRLRLDGFRISARRKASRMTSLALL